MVIRYAGEFTLGGHALSSRSADSWYSLNRLTATDSELIAEVFLYGGSWLCSLVDRKSYWTTRGLAKGLWTGIC